MEKIAKFIHRNENILIILLIVISLIGVVFYVSLDVTDELWNFQNVYKLYNGFQIYKDANVICTPLFFYLGNIIFNILGANFFVFRIYNIIIFTFYYFMTYKILRELGINTKISTISILILMMFGNYLIPRVMANYNTLTIAISLLGVYLLIRNKCKIDSKNIIIQSIICFLIILTKQNIGMYYLIALTVIILFKNKNKRIRGFLLEVGILLVLSSIFLAFLKVNNLLDGFINYAILGIRKFANDNISIDLYYIIMDILILLINLSTSIFIAKQTKIPISKDEKNNLFVLNCFSIGISLLIYPIANETHFLFAISIAIILLIYISNIILKKGDIKLKKENSIITLLLIVLIISDVGINVYEFIKWNKEIFSDEYVYSYEEPLFGSIVDNDISENIQIVTNYIKEKESEGKDVVVFSSKAALYMIPLKQSNGFYDLPFNGNFGAANEQDVINELGEKENTLILVEKDENNINWQENEFIIQTIKEKFRYVGEIEEFSIYTP